MSWKKTKSVHFQVSHLFGSRWLLTVSSVQFPDVSTYHGKKTVGGLSPWPHILAEGTCLQVAWQGSLDCLRGRENSQWGEDCPQEGPAEGALLRGVLTVENVPAGGSTGDRSAWGGEPWGRKGPAWTRRVVLAQSWVMERLNLSRHRGVIDVFWLVLIQNVGGMDQAGQEWTQLPRSPPDRWHKVGSYFHGEGAFVFVCVHTHTYYVLLFILFTCTECFPFSLMHLFRSSSGLNPGRLINGRGSEQ